MRTYIVKKAKGECLNSRQLPAQSHCSVAIIFNPVDISHPAAVSPCQRRTGKCQHGRHFLALEIKPNLRILIVKPISYRQTNLRIPNLAQSLCKSYSHIRQVPIF